jgi:hypothetical protein
LEHVSHSPPIRGAAPSLALDTDVSVLDGKLRASKLRSLATCSR